MVIELSAMAHAIGTQSFHNLIVGGVVREVVAILNSDGQVLIFWCRPHDRVHFDRVLQVEYGVEKVCDWHLNFFHIWRRICLV